MAAADGHSLGGCSSGLGVGGRGHRLHAQPTQLAEQGHALDWVEALVSEYRGAFMRGLRDRMIGI